MLAHAAAICITCLRAPALAQGLPGPTLKSLSSSETTTSLLLSQYAKPAGTNAPGDPFNPVLTSGTPSSSAPQISDITRHALPGDGVVILGDKIAVNPTGLSSAWVFGLSGPSPAVGTLLQAELLKTGSSSLMPVISGSFNYGMVLVWLKNAAGYSYPVRVNATEAWWLDKINTTPGSTVQVFGRNLSHGEGITTSYVHIRPWGDASNTPSISCTVSNVNPYHVSFQIPATATTGTDYEVWVHNGHGGDYGWSGRLRLSIDAITTVTNTNPHWELGVTTNVAAYGLALTPPVQTGTGGDDTTVIQAAISATPAGGTIYFPTGTYNISSRVACAKKLRFLGPPTGGGATIQNLDPSYSGTNLYLLHLQGFPISLENLSVNCSATTALIASVRIASASANPTGRGVNISNCTFTIRKDSPIHGIDFYLADDVAVKNCNFTLGEALFFSKDRRVEISGNTFKGNVDTVVTGALGYWSASELNCSGNWFGPNNRTFSSGTTYSNREGLYRAVVIQNASGFSENTYIANNTTYNVGPYLGTFSNSGENILLETGTMTYTGYPTSVSADGMTLTFGASPTQLPTTANQLVTDTPGNTQGACVYVDSGPGAGQWRKITASDSTTVTINRPWDVIPLSGTGNSRIVVTRMSARSVIYNNDLSSTSDENNNSLPDYIEQYSNGAQVGVSLYGAQAETVVASNRITNMAQGIYVLGSSRSITGSDFGGNDSSFVVDPVSNLYVYDNSIAGVGRGIVSFTSATPVSGGRGGFSNPDCGPCLLHQVIAHNRIASAAQTGVELNRASEAVSWIWPFDQESLIQGNSILDSGTGCAVGVEETDNAFYANTIDRSSFLATAVGFDFSPNKYNKDVKKKSRLALNSVADTIPVEFKGTVPWSIDYGFNESGTILSDITPITITSNLGNLGGSGTATGFGGGSVVFGPDNYPASGVFSAQFNDTNTIGGFAAKGGLFSAAFPGASGDFTVMFSLRLTGTQAVNDVILNTLGGVRVYVASTPRTIRIEAGGAYLIRSLADGIWTHIAVSYSHLLGLAPNFSAVKFYVDGLSVDAGQQNFALDSTFSAQTAYFGAQSDGTNPINGALDNIVFTDWAMGHMEVRDFAQRAGFQAISSGSPLDSDGDSIPDGWESQYGLDPFNSTDATQDADGDEISNLNEYLAGTDPLNSADYLHIASLTTTGANRADVMIVFKTAVGKSYRIERTDSLPAFTWQTVGDIVGTGSNAEIQDVGAVLAAPRRFYRCRLLP